MVGKHHLLRIVTGVNNTSEAEEVRCIVNFSVSLRSLLSPKLWSSQFDLIDVDQDGLLSYNEFYQFITSFTSMNSDLAKLEEHSIKLKLEYQIANNLTKEIMQQVKELFDYISAVFGSEGRISLPEHLESMRVFEVDIRPEFMKTLQN